MSHYLCLLFLLPLLKQSFTIVLNRLSLRPKEESYKNVARAQKVSKNGVLAHYVFQNCQMSISLSLRTNICLKSIIIVVIQGNFFCGLNLFLGNITLWLLTLSPFIPGIPHSPLSPWKGIGINTFELHWHIVLVL